MQKTYSIRRNNVEVSKYVVGVNGSDAICRQNSIYEHARQRNADRKGGKWTVVIVRG